jgi:LPPG:FO 2-phospho-L-lactate transferase
MGQVCRSSWCEDCVGPLSPILLRPLCAMQKRISFVEVSAIQQRPGPCPLRGVGGAKLVLGLSRVVPAGRLVVAANTGDDFEHLGLEISPDIDTFLYTLAGLDNPNTGWRRRGETWTFMVALEALGGETWFRLGDGDIAIHIERTRRLRARESPSPITAEFSRRLGVATRIVPMSDDKVRTRIRTPDTWLDFQKYFDRCESEVLEVAFEGAVSAKLHPDLLATITDPKLRAIVICPSNPFISIEPILAVPGRREALDKSDAPIIGVAPIIAGRTLKGPTAKMMRELGMPVSAAAVARHYVNLLTLISSISQMQSARRISRSIPWSPRH